MPPFKYLPLDTARQEIRLIRLIPDQFDNEICVEIFHETISLTHVPKYEALSYVWGSTQKLRRITVRSAKAPGVKLLEFLSVTENLWTALQYLRRSDSARVFWIDAICINQEDVCERSVEVGRMGLVFGRASQTIVWLGPPSENSGLAIETLRWIGEDITYHPQTHMLSVEKNSRAMKLEYDAKAQVAKEAEWKAIQDLLYRGWFTRLWIYQEIRLSRLAIVVVGQSKIPWATFRSAVNWLTMLIPATPSLSTIFDLDYCVTYIYPTFLLSASRPFAPVTVLEKTKNAACTDPKDRIYGILNLCASEINVTVDYSQTKEQIYEQFTRSQINDHKMLRVLAFLDERKYTELIPFARASGRSRHAGRFSASGKHLEIIGVSVATIDHLEKAIPNQATLPEIIEICRSWEPPEVSNKMHDCDGNLLATYIKTLVCGNVKEEQPPNIGTILWLKKCREAYFDLRNNGKVDSLSHRFGVDMRSKLRGRAFGTTQNGYMGAFPAAAQIGDHVCAVLGSSALLLLRPAEQKDQFSVVGECYLSGLMEGEGLLGPLPGLWKFGQVDSDDNRSFIYNGDKSTQTLEDPRLGTLPPGWEIAYLDGTERGKNGNLHHRWFRNTSSNEETWFDPRLTEGELSQRGVSLRRFCLI